VKATRRTAAREDQVQRLRRDWIELGFPDFVIRVRTASGSDRIKDADESKESAQFI